MNSRGGETKLPGTSNHSSMETSILLVGVNHNTAPVEIREKLALSGEEIIDALKILRNQEKIPEAMILSTCNRVEFLMAGVTRKKVIHAVSYLLKHVKGIDPERVSPSFYIYEGKDAIRHIFSVAAGLDSMILGEPQILGQVKSAYKASVDAKGTGVILNRLLHKTFSVAKRVRTETGIGSKAVSVSYAAVELAKKIFGSLSDKSVCLVGAGEMAELAVEHLAAEIVQGVIFVANRTFTKGLELAKRFSGKAIRIEELPDILKQVDIIISSTGAPGYIIRPDQVKSVMRARKQKPLFFIDIAVPRDIDPGVNRLENIYLYDIDDLRGIVEENMASRKAESARANRIIDEAVIRFSQWLDSLDAVPTIKDFHARLMEIIEGEIEKTAHLLSLSPRQKEGLQRMSAAISKKILHQPASFLKDPGEHHNKAMYISVLRKAFGLDDEKES